MRLNETNRPTALSSPLLRPLLFSRTLLGVAVLVGLTSVGLSGCSDNDSIQQALLPDTPAKTEFMYAADIQYTNFGIPHITADTYKGLGYGAGFTFAKDNICSFAREVVVANGQSMLYLGDEGNVAEDVFYTWYNTPDRRTLFINAQDPEVIDMLTGYVAGYSRYLRDTGVANIDPDCAGEDWVREIDIDDLLSVYGKANLRGGLSNFVAPVVAAAPPASTQNSSNTGTISQHSATQAKPDFDFSRINVLDGKGGSNAYALGSAITENGSGILYGNPHQLWEGTERFYQLHLTIPGELDVMGASQQGQPFINIGFNKDIAWTHTVSTAKRFTLYQLDLVAGNPMKYTYKNSDGLIEERDISAVDVTIELPNNETLVQPIYFSHYGPMIAVNLINGALPTWGTSDLAYTIRDAASENQRALNQWRSMNKATSTEDLVDSLQDTLGLGFVNTIAVDRYGKALYADISTVPHVTAAQLNACSENAGFYLPAIINFGVPALNGSLESCEWGNDADSPQKGIFGRSNLPFLIRDDYVSNSNDSYWLSNLDQPVTGFSPLLRRQITPFIGANPVEGVALSLRSRMAFSQILDRLDNSDGLGGTTFNLQNLQQVVYGNRSYAAELVLDDVLADCRANSQLPLSTGSTIDGALACATLTNWDRRNNLDSRGAHIFREFWQNVDLGSAESTLFKVPFTTADPLNTPRDFIINGATRSALGDAIKNFNDKGIAIDATLGNHQYVLDTSMNNDRIPMHGGLGREGVFNVAIASKLTEAGDYSPITFGPTYMQTVTFDTNGPVAEALLAYSQSADSTRPNHRDQTYRYSNKDWISLPFSADEIANQAVGDVVELRE